jgi:hypothetical protein
MTYFDQTMRVEYPTSRMRAIMVEAFTEFMPALTLRALFESPEWPVVLESIEAHWPSSWAFFDACSAAQWDFRPRSLEQLGVLALESLSLEVIKS